MATRYLLDSDICIYAMKRRPPTLLKRLDRSAPVSAISVIVYGELWFGRTVRSHRDAASASLTALLESIEVQPLPVEAGTHYGAVRAALESAGTPIGTNDTWIAAHALAGDLTLVTNNERGFERVAGLRVENWTR
jgi:tRNA(fMet)-specific endonuclease VapC